MRLFYLLSVLVLSISGAFAGVNASVYIKQIITPQDGRAYIQFERQYDVEGTLQCNDNILYLGFNPNNSSTLGVQTDKGMLAVALTAMTSGMSVRFTTDASGSNCYTNYLGLQNK